MPPKTKKSSKSKKVRQYRGKKMSTKKIRHERAFVTEVGSAPTICNPNQSYQMYNVNLSNTARAKVVAQGYLEYRIKRVTLRFKPSQDTFVSGTGAPYLYYKIDRDLSCNGFSNVAQYRALGCKGRRFDESVLSVSWTPSVLTGVADNQPTIGQLKIQKPIKSPWLAVDNDNTTPTIWNPSEIDHLGITWILDQQFATGTPIQYSVERVVEYEFRKSAIALLTVEPGPDPIDVFMDDKDEVN